MKFPLTLIISTILYVHLQHQTSCELISFRGQNPQDSPSVLLRKENSSFEMDVNFEGASPVKMLFTPHKSTTLLASNCLNFEPFDCVKYQCQKYQDERTQFAFFYFRSYGYSVETDIFLGDHDWNLKTKTIFSLNCSQGIQTYGNGTSGIIGLGLKNKARNNYKTPNPIFSVSYESDALGWLSFNKNLSQAKSENPILSFSADDNWQILGGQGIAVDNRVVNKNVFSAILDPNTNTLGLPQDIFNDTIAYFNNKRSLAMICPISTEKDYYKPVCRYQGVIEALPNMQLIIQGKKLVISPWQYIEDAKNYDRTKGSLTLNLRALKANAPSSDNYVIDLYDGHIIIGLNFLKDFVMVFLAGTEKNKNIIEIYEKPQANPNPPSQSFIYWIIGILSAILVLSVCVWIYMRRKASKDRVDTAHLLQVQDEGVQVTKHEGKDTTFRLNEEADRQGLDESESAIPNNPEGEEEDLTSIQNIINNTN